MARKFVRDSRTDLWNIYSTVVDEYLLEEFVTLDNAINTAIDWKVEEVLEEFADLKIKLENNHEGRGREYYDILIKEIHNDEMV